MLHSQNIAAVLRQALRPCQLQDLETVSPLSVSLLSSNGQPLCSVFSPSSEQPQKAVTAHEEGDQNGQASSEEFSFDLSLKDTLRMYSLILSNEFTLQSSWEILELNNGNYISLQKLDLPNESNTNADGTDELGFFVLMMINEAKYPKKLAKITLEKLGQVLQDGLKGYQIE